MSLTFLYSLLIVMYVFFNQHLTTSMALNKESYEGNNLSAENIKDHVLSAEFDESNISNGESDISNVSAGESDQSNDVSTRSGEENIASGEIDGGNISSIENDASHSSEKDKIVQPRTPTKWVLGKDSIYHECPTNESLVDAEDIMTFIDYIYDRQSYKEQIMSNYTEHAQEVAEIHSKHVDKLEVLVGDPAHHLNYTLEELAVLKNSTMDPIMKQVQDEIDEKPQLENEFKLRAMDLHVSIRMLKDFKKICRHNCRSKLKYHVEKRIKFGRSFCVNLHDLYDNIESKLSVVAESIKTSAHSLINKIDKKLAKKENALRRKIEKGFLGKSGKILIHALKVENEIEKLNHDLKEIDNGSLTLEELGAQMDNQSIEFRRQIEEYGKYCVDCDREILQIEQIENRMPGDAIVSDLIRVKYEHVWNAVQTHVKSFYLGLFAQLKRIKKLKIKDQYRLTNEEEAELRYVAGLVLDHLQMIIPQPPTRRVIELAKNCKDLLRKIQVKLIKAYSYDALN
ncbi:uncharacterized protein LOC121738925 [Aricia agestis]|uniref:uncharacterized protein LOC121738925 n=1 Tax=Aricia agestis TaxID=91739 RepID=UPI001C201FCB|nr:uncharacterized protein LOC121738925 [Aricia agestis]